MGYEISARRPRFYFNNIALLEYLGLKVCKKTTETKNFVDYKTVPTDFNVDPVSTASDLYFNDIWIGLGTYSVYANLYLEVEELISSYLYMFSGSIVDAETSNSIFFEEGKPVSNVNPDFTHIIPDKGYILYLTDILGHYSGININVFRLHFAGPGNEEEESTIHHFELIDEAHDTEGALDLFYRLQLSHNPYVMLLGHQLREAHGESAGNIVITYRDIDTGNWSNLDQSINVEYLEQDNVDIGEGGASGEAIIFEAKYPGWSLLNLPAHTAIKGLYAISANPSYLSTVVVGNYWEMPASCHLESLVLRYETDGIKKRNITGSGATLVDYQYIGPKKWGNLPPWEIANILGDYPIYAKVGRRVWEMTFTMKDTDLYPSVLATSNMNSSYAFEDYNQMAFENTDTILQQYPKGGGDFYSNCVFKTAGMKLPFIFNPNGAYTSTDADTTYPNHSDMAVCEFDQNSFSLTQKNKNIYELTLVIKEIW